ncbi:ABC transporter permease, partial [Nonomuraea sp. KM90]|uniref:ABC transporter permease n=1 Tax=Nonomuraea sp. KM90 TaxID=3457428 RepID=UPI003FCCEF71
MTLLDARPATPARVRARRRLRPGRPIKLGFLLGPLLLLALWTAASATGLLDPRFLSAPWTVITTAAELTGTGRLPDNLLTSVGRVALGLAIGVPLGLALALVSGLSRWGEAIIDGPVQIKRAVPSLALMPLLILWLGIGEVMKVTVIAVGVLVP